jgi:hypothetical protein
LQELETMEKSKIMIKMNDNSRYILRQKFERTVMEQPNESDSVNFDLWPVQMEKQYFEK